MAKRRINLDLLVKQWEIERQEERERAALSLKITAAGYRSLSAAAHPDRQGGSREEMSKLAEAKKWLDEHIRKFV